MTDCRLLGDGVGGEVKEPRLLGLLGERLLYLRREVRELGRDSCPCAEAMCDVVRVRVKRVRV